MEIILDYWDGSNVITRVSKMVKGKQEILQERCDSGRKTQRQHFEDGERDHEPVNVMQGNRSFPRACRRNTVFTLVLDPEAHFRPLTSRLKDNTLVLCKPPSLWWFSTAMAGDSQRWEPSGPLFTVYISTIVIAYQTRSALRANAVSTWFTWWPDLYPRAW